jgi:hypothetical protein
MGVGHKLRLEVPANGFYFKPKPPKHPFETADLALTDYRILEIEQPECLDFVRKLAHL